MNYKSKVINRFDELAPSYSSKAVEFIKEKRLNFIKKYIIESDCVLEVGCGSGNLLKEIRCKALFGLDISPKMIEECKKNLPQGNFVVGDAENLPFKDNSFDKVIISEVLYYLPLMDKAIQEAFRVLKKDGLLLITSLNKKYNFVKTLVKLLRIGIHDDVSMAYISFKELIKCIEKDFKIEETASIPIKFISPDYSLIFFIKARKK